MQTFFYLITCVAFAAHALLGCGVHYTCQHRIAGSDCVAQEHSLHNCVAHSHGESHETADEQSPPESPCEHADCSFVKADTVRVDLGDRDIQWIAAAMPIESAVAAHVDAADREPVCVADYSSAQLYVWHCALII